jgi:hypothetical protein
LRRRLASSCRSTLASAEQCIGSNLAAIGDAPVAKRAANLVQFPFGMIVEPAGSSFLTAQKTGGRAHRFFACHFLAYAQGGQSDRTPKGRKRSLCNVASTSTSAASRICSAERRPGNCSSHCRRRTWSSVGRSLKIQRARVAAPRSHSVAAASPQTRSAGAGPQQLRRHFRSRSVPGL